MGARGSVVALGIAAALLLASGAGAASAGPATIGSYPHWTETDAGHFTGALSAAAGGGVIHVSTDGAGSGLSDPGRAFLGAQTGFGIRFGTASDQPSLTLTAPAGASSTTTVELPSLPSGWAFAVGDVDTEKVGLVARNGSATLKPAQFGPQDTLDVPQLNFCAGASPMPRACPASVTTGDAPWWCPDGSKRAGAICASLPAYPAVVGNGADTDGAYDWFVPTAPVTRLTLTVHAATQTGSIQLWIAAPVAPTAVTGTVTGPAGAAPAAGTSVAVQRSDGSPVLGLQGDPLLLPVAADGGFTLTLEHGDYRLVVHPPVGFSAPAPTTFSASSPTLVLPPVAITQGLPGTGVDVGWWPIAAIVLVALGIVLLLVRLLLRRRRG